MTTKHTPGPWKLDDRGYKFIVHKPGDGYITRDICRMDSSTMAAFAQEANARLIVAAPELLEALDRIQDAIQNFIEKGLRPTESVMRQWQVDARAAIAKATGE